MTAGKLSLQKKRKDKDTICEVDPFVPFECVGNVIAVRPGHVIIECTQKFRIPVPPDILADMRLFLMKGKRVGILSLPDGSIRVRSL